MNILKKLLPVLFLLFGMLHTSAQSWQWLKRGGYVGTNPNALLSYMPIATATDKHGNVYLLGENRDTSSIDGHLVYNAKCKMTLTSWDCNGNFRWLKVLGGAALGNSSAIGMATDSLEGIYVSGVINSTGSTTDSAYFDTDTSVRGFSGSYIIKYNSNGAFQWFKMPERTQNITPQAQMHRLAVSPDGHLFWCAHLAAGTYDGGTFMVSADGYYIVEYSASGVFQSHTALPITTTAPAANATVIVPNLFSRDHASGKCYIAGNYNQAAMGTLTIGGIAISTAGSTSPMYVAAFAANGGMIWVKQADNRDAVSLTNDRDGNLFIMGGGMPNSVFNGDTLTGTVPSTINSLPYIAALDTAGGSLWSLNATHQKYGKIAFQSMAQVNNDIGITGSYNDSSSWGGHQLYSKRNIPFFTRINAATGAVMQIDTLPAYAWGETGLIAADNKSGFYSTGVFDSVIYHAGAPVYTVGSNKMNWFIARHGKNNCSCQMPYPDFTVTQTGTNSFSFTYTGTTPYTSINWDFGDGATATGTATPSHTYTGTQTYPVCVTTVNGCDNNTACHYVTITTNIVHELQDFPGLSVYPNPVSKAVTIEKAGKETVLEIYTLSGNRVLSKTLSGDRETISVHHLSSGVYLMRFTNLQGNQGMQRLIKE